MFIGVYMRLVMKFGGTSVGNAERIRAAAEIVRKYRGEETLVVTSAMSGVTDRLVEISEKVLNGVDEGYIKNFIKYLENKHFKALKEINSSENTEFFNEISDMLSELEKVLIGVSYVGELTPRSRDFILSFGERLVAPLVSAAIEKSGVKSGWYTGYEAGIVTDQNFGDATPDFEETAERVNSILYPRLKEIVPVVTGFVAADFRGRITTLGRGGSDYTAAILGSVLEADEIWIWTDVDGILTADPRLVEDARIIKEISYIEAMELAYFGAKVLHPKRIEPAMEKGIPVRVKNSFKPDSPGTVIVNEQEKTNDIVKAISIKGNAVLLTVSGVGMIGVPGVAARVFKALADKKVNILMISQGSSEANISMVIDQGDIDNAVIALKEEFIGANIVRDVNYNEDVSIVAVVGTGMKGTEGVAARVFKAISDAGVNVVMIAQGSSEVNISFVVGSEDAGKAAKALHREFIET